MSYRLGPRFRKQEKITSSIWGIPYLGEGPPVQNRLWDVLVRSIFYPAILCAGIEKDFLRIRIRESKRDCFRFQWDEAINDHKIEIYRVWTYAATFHIRENFGCSF